MDNITLKPSVAGEPANASEHSNIDAVTKYIRQLNEELARLKKENTDSRMTAMESVGVLREKVGIFSDTLERFLRRESIAVLFGAILLFILTAAHLLGNPPDILGNAFLIILGYFFGQNVERSRSGDFNKN